MCIDGVLFLLPAKSTKDHCNRQGAIHVPVKPVTLEVQVGGKQRRGALCRDRASSQNKAVALTSPPEKKRDRPRVQISATPSQPSVARPTASINPDLAPLPAPGSAQAHRTPDAAERKALAPRDYRTT